MKHIYLSAIVLPILFTTISCVQDEPLGGGNITKEERETNEWIYDKLSDYYLWYDEMPTEENAKFSYEPEAFFKSLLSDKDGKTYSSGGRYYYSTISPKSGTKSYQGDEPSFGFEYQAWRDSKTNFMGLQILYVLPGSPASNKNLKRGDWILQIDGKNVGNNYYDLIDDSNELTFGIGEKFAKDLTLTTVNLIKASVKDNPVFISKIVEGNVRNVGYLVYNHFTTGPEGTSDTSFDDDMVNAIKDLKSKGAQEFVLDLRYNGGGYVTSAQKLASALSPQSALDNIFCKLTMNDKHSNEDYSLKLSSKYNAELNLTKNRLFVITSSRTASASELIIAGLQPYMDVILVGETTEGKNVGSREFKEDDYEWILHPIVCYVTNAEDDIYSDGIDATFGFNYDYSVEASITLKDLGNHEEEVLKGILGYIQNGAYPTGSPWTKTKTTSMDITALNSSLDRKRTNAVKLNDIDF